MYLTFIKIIHYVIYGQFFIKPIKVIDKFSALLWIKKKYEKLLRNAMIITAAYCT